MLTNNQQFYEYLNWVPVTLENSWNEYALAGAAQQPLSFSKTRNGLLLFRGLVGQSTPTSTKAFTLPDWAHPRYDINLCSQFALNPSGYQVMHISIEADGDVRIYNTPASFYWGSFNGVFAPTHL